MTIQVQYVLNDNVKWQFQSSLGVPPIGATIHVYNDWFEIVSVAILRDRNNQIMAKIFLERR